MEKNLIERIIENKRFLMKMCFIALGFLMLLSTLSSAWFLDLLGFKTPGFAVLSPKCFLGGVIFLAIAAAIEGLESIPTGYIGIVKFGATLTDTILKEGLHFRLPFFWNTEMVKSTKRVCTGETNGSPTKGIFIVKYNYTINYLPKPENILSLFREYGSFEVYESAVIEASINKLVNNYCENKTHDDISEKQSDIDDKLKPDFVKEIEAEAEATSSPVFLTVSFFKLDLIEDPKYKEEKQEIEKVRFNKEKATLDAEAQMIKADADLYEAQKQAEGNAYKIQQEGKAEAEKKKIMGEVLRNNPELIEQTRAENPVLVNGGGANPIINVPTPTPTPKP